MNLHTFCNEIRKWSVLGRPPNGTLRKKAEIMEVLVLTTAHLKEETAMRLDARTHHTDWIEPVKYGYLMACPELDMKMVDFGLPEAVPEEARAAMVLARHIGCKRVLYDMDGEEHPFLSNAGYIYHW